MLWIVGPTYTGFLHYLSEHNIPFGLFSAKQPKQSHGAAKVVVIDLSQPETVHKTLQQLKLDVSAVIALYEQYVVSAAAIAEYYRVAGMPIEAARACTNKLLMRKRFVDFDPRITPYFAEASKLEDALVFAEDHGYPVIMKPSNLMKSLLVTTSNNVAELENNFRQTSANLASISDKFHVATAPLIIEECMTGTMHTVVAFVGPYGQPYLVPQIVDCLTAQDIGKNDNYLFSRSLPSELSEAQQTNIREVAAKGLKSLGLRSSAAHVEIMLTSDGPKIIEIGARMGGYRPRLYQLACGFDMYGALLSCLEGTSPDVSGSRRDYAAALEIFSDKEGPFSMINDPGLLTLPSVQYSHIYAKPGKLVGPARLGYKAGVVIVLADPDKERLAADCTAIRNGLSITVD